MQLMLCLATNMMPLIVTNITQNFTAQIITQKFVLHMNTALSEMTDVLRVFSNRVLQQPGSVYISSYELSLYHSSDTGGFEMASGFLENLWSPSIVCIFNSPIQK